MRGFWKSWTKARGNSAFICCRIRPSRSTGFMACTSNHDIGPPLDLSLTLAEFLKEKPRTHHFAVELVLAIRVNTRWRVAPEKVWSALGCTYFGVTT
jgi:hypothetical protein